MKKIHISCCFVVLASLAAILGCRQHDWRELTIEVPEMRNEAAARVVVQALSRGPGIERDSLRVDMENGTVTFIYDSLLAADKNYEYLIAKAGLTANGIPPDAQARRALPANVLP